MIVKCPACGSSELDIVENRQSLPVVYGEPAKYVERITHCRSCGESGDFDGDNDVQIESVYEAAKKHSAGSMLKYLGDIGVRRAYIERVLELPARTLARWKVGKASASGIALLRILRTFPWILEVAESDFDSNVAKSKVFEAASRVLERAVSDHTHSAQIVLSGRTDKVEVYASFVLSTPLSQSEWLEKPQLMQMTTAGV